MHSVLYSVRKCLQSVSSMCCAQGSLKNYNPGELDRIEAILLFGEPVEWESQLQLLIDMLVTNGKPDKCALPPLSRSRPVPVPVLVLKYECANGANVLRAEGQSTAPRRATTCRSSWPTWTCSSCTGPRCRASARAPSSCASRRSIRCVLVFDFDWTNSNRS